MEKHAISAAPSMMDLGDILVIILETLKKIVKILHKLHLILSIFILLCYLVP